MPSIEDYKRQAIMARALRGQADAIEVGDAKFGGYAQAGAGQPAQYVMDPFGPAANLGKSYLKTQRTDKAVAAEQEAEASRLRVLQGMLGKGDMAPVTTSEGGWGSTPIDPSSPEYFVALSELGVDTGMFSHLAGEKPNPTVLYQTLASNPAMAPIYVAKGWITQEEADSLLEEMELQKVLESERELKEYRGKAEADLQFTAPKPLTFDQQKGLTYDQLMKLRKEDPKEFRKMLKAQREITNAFLPENDRNWTELMASEMEKIMNMRLGPEYDAAMKSFNEKFRPPSQVAERFAQDRENRVNELNYQAQQLQKMIDAIPENASFDFADKALQLIDFVTEKEWSSLLSEEKAIESQIIDQFQLKAMGVMRGLGAMSNQESMMVKNTLWKATEQPSTKRQKMQQLLDAINYKRANPELGSLVNFLNTKHGIDIPPESAEDTTEYVPEAGYGGVPTTQPTERKPIFRGYLKQ